tara:strand:+ start:87 stop:227 length:141 start_codon:yes stop_codon:yes gene_type:complete
VKNHIAFEMRWKAPQYLDEEIYPLSWFFTSNTEKIDVGIIKTIGFG